MKINLTLFIKPENLKPHLESSLPTSNVDIATGPTNPNTLLKKKNLFIFNLDPHVYYLKGSVIRFYEPSVLLRV